MRGPADSRTRFFLHWQTSGTTVLHYYHDCHHIHKLVVEHHRWRSRVPIGARPPPRSPNARTCAPKEEGALSLEVGPLRSGVISFEEVRSREYHLREEGILPGI